MTDTACPSCPLCAGDGGTLVARNAQLRVVHADEPGFPAFYRVIWNAHVAEFSDLTPSERSSCMDAVVAVEQALRAELQPTKINLAALGNMVPHLHWHVVARFEGDSHFPAPVWAQPQRLPDPAVLAAVQARRDAVHQRISKNIAEPAINPRATA